MLKKVIYIFVLISLVSCIPTKHFINNIHKTEKVLKSESMLIVVNPEVVINSFKKTFNKNYESNEVFLKMYAIDFQSLLKANNLYSKVAIDLNNKWKAFSEGYSKKNNDIINNLLTKTDKKYLLYLKGVTIDNYVSSSYSPGFGPGAMGTHNSTEFCTVSVTVVIYDVKAMKQVLEFESTGESSVFFFDFTKTLIKARDRSIENAIKYLKTGKTS